MGMRMRSLLSRNNTTLPGISGSVRIDRDTGKLLRRVGRGDIVVLDEVDLDRATADILIEAQVTAVVNASPSISGRFPNLGPQRLVDSGVMLIDNVGTEIFGEVKDGTRVRLFEGEVYVGEERVARGAQLFDDEVAGLLLDAKKGLVDHLEAFSGNTIEYIRSESALLIDGVGVPAVDVNLTDRHVVVVSDGPDHVKELRNLKPFIKEYSPILIGVGKGADALKRAGYRPDLIVGDPEDVGTETLKAAGQVILPADADGHARGLARIQDLGLGAMTFPATGSSTDLALLLAYHHGAALIVTVGVSASLNDFFDREKVEGAPSTFLTRMRVGERLVDGAAVATLYRSRVSGAAIAMFILAIMVAAMVALLVSNAGQAQLDWAINTWNSFALWVQGLFR